MNAMGEEKQCNHIFALIRNMEFFAKDYRTFNDPNDKDSADECYLLIQDYLDGAWYE